MDLSEHFLLDAWANATADGAFCLPVCQDCGQVLYPLRENCSCCLCASVNWEVIDNRATVVTSTSLNHSLEPRFRDQLPWYIASVRLDAGPVAIVSGSEVFKPGDRVVLKIRYENGGGELPLMFAEQAP